MCAFSDSHWDSLCIKHSIPHPNMDRSSHDWSQHSPTSWSPKIWGNYSSNYSPNEKKKLTRKLNS